MLNSLKNKVIISVQAMPDEPLYKEECMFAMMQSVLSGGAAGLRVAGARDVKNAKKLAVPVIGLTKPDKMPENADRVVYITPTLEDVSAVISAGADIIAFDGTSRPRPDGSDVKEIISVIKSKKRYSMADISNYEEAQYCINAGADIVSTTLSGYTSYTLNESGEPDFELLKKIVSNYDTPVFLEGRIQTPEQVDRAFDIGAYAVVIGSAVTRPKLITRKFTERTV